MSVGIDTAISAFFAQFATYTCEPRQQLENFTAYNTRRYINLNIPESQIQNFLDSYWAVVKNGDSRIVVQEMLRAKNGIVLDFDLYSDNSRQISTDELYDLVMIVYDYIQEVSDTTSTWLWVGTKEPRIKNTVFKKSFRVHMLSPRAAVHEREFIIKGLKRTGAFITWCTRQMPKNADGSQMTNVVDCLDTQAHRNPAGLFLSSKPPMAPTYEILPPHVFHSLYHITQTGRRTNVLTHSYEQFSTYNVAAELSLAHSGRMIQKTDIIMRAELDIKKDLKPLAVNIKQIVSADIEAAEIWTLLELLPIEICDTYDSWRKIVTTIKAAGEKYKILAAEWSKKSKKFELGKFEQVWATGGNVTNGHLVLRKILRDHSSPTTYANYEHTTMQNYVMSEINGVLGNRGELTDMVVARIMVFCHRYKFIWDGDSRWLTLVEPNNIGENDSTRHYKWCVSPKNDTFRLLIVSTLGAVLPNIIQKLDYHAEEKTKQAKPADVKGIKVIRDNLNRAYRRYQTAAGLSGVIELSRALFTNRMFVKELDLVKTAIGVRGGVLMLDLAPDVMSPAPRLIDTLHDLPITKSTDAAYIPYTAELARTAKFRQVLEFFMNFFPKGECDSFYWMMHVIGQAVSGETKTPMLVNCVGSGRNGKTALTEYVSSVLGAKQYADILPMCIFTGRVADAQKSNPAIMALRGLRWCTVTESKRGDVLADDQLKTMVGGGGLMSARGHHQEQQTFEPSAAMVSTSNYKLRVVSNDYGTWRRLRYLEMKNRMVASPDPSKPNDRLGDHRWMDEYRRDRELVNIAFTIFVEFYYSIKINYKYAIDKVPCATVERETATYQNECDTVAKFIDRRIIKTGDTRNVLSLLDIAREYKNWCTELSAKTTMDLIDAQNIISSSSLADEFDKSSDSCALVGYIIGNATGAKSAAAPINYLSSNTYTHTYAPIRHNMDLLRGYFTNFDSVFGTLAE